MNYHEMTMNEPRNSPARRQQFSVICAVMAAAFVYSAITSGAFLEVKTTEGPFPGGNFCYKFATRDYAASMGLGRRIAEEWAKGTTTTTMSITKDDESNEILNRKKSVQKRLYNVYLDNPMKMGGTRQRYMTGVLVSDSEKATFCEPLLEKNPKIEEVAAKQRHIPMQEKKVAEVFEETLYQYVDLPSVDSLVVHFPFTNGFLSALIFSYKILPKLRALAVEKGESGNIPVVISHCSIEQEMCTHYAPLVQGKDFLVGQPTTEEHLEALGPETFLDWEHLKGGARKISPKFMKTYIDMLP